MTDIVTRLRGLIALNYPGRGGPYRGTAATMCMEAMTDAADEIEKLRQAIWDAFIMMGGDHDGDLSHKAVHPSRGWDSFLRDQARQWRFDYDEAIEESA